MVSGKISKRLLCTLLAACVREAGPGQEYARPTRQALQVWPTLNSLATLAALSEILGPSCLKPQPRHRRINAWLQLCDRRSGGGDFVFHPIGLLVWRTESSRRRICPTRSCSPVDASLFLLLASRITTMPGQRNPNGGIRRPSAVHNLPL